MSDQIHLYGFAPVRQCLLNNNRSYRILYIKDKGRSPRLKELEQLARKRGITVQRLNRYQLGTLAGQTSSRHCITL